MARIPSLLLLALALLPACAVPRPTLKPEELEAVRDHYLASARAATRATNKKMLSRMRAERETHLTAQPDDGDYDRSDAPTYDILILSGGGDYGAFGAGFLKAWGDCKHEHFDRPQFDMVTGVSTGALIAPFAFIGDDPSYDRLVDLYSQPKPSWFRVRGLLFFLPGNESFADNSGLRKDLEAIIDDDLIRRIAACSRDNRVLAVNTTNLDVGAMHPFALGIEAEQAEVSGDRNRFIDILLASTAIPAVFPPVIIDGSLYVDGGTTSNILYGSNWLSPAAPLARWREQYPGDPLPRLRFWVIINNQLSAGPQIVQPTWLSITRASLATTIRASTTTSLRHLYSQCQALRAAGIEAEFRYVAIPLSWIPPNDRQFDAEVMKSLADLGMKMGADHASWRTDFTDDSPRFAPATAPATTSEVPHH